MRSEMFSQPSSRAMTVAASFADMSSRSRGTKCPRHARTCPSTNRGRRESRVPDAPAASCAKVKSTRVSHHRFAGSIRPSLRNGFNGLSRALVSGKSARMCERAVVTNRPSLDLSPFVLKGCEPDGERGTDPVSSSTRTVAWAFSPDRARKGVDDGTKRLRCRRH
jgi:hypothetical protein